MKVTTIRFGEDLWRAVAREAEQAGVSTSQFIREAALARAAASAGARGDLLFEPISTTLHELAPSSIPEARQLDVQRAAAALSRAVAADTRSEAEALRAQSDRVLRHHAASRSANGDAKQPS